MWQVLASFVTMALIMKMEMTTDEKDIFLAQTINEHFHTQKTNPLYIPSEHLKAKGFDLSDVSNSLWRLKENKVISKYKLCWGFFEIKKGDKKIFIVTGEEKHTDEDFEVYELKVNRAQIDALLVNHSDNNELTFYLNSNGDFYKEPKDAHCYEMKDKGIPLKILNYFIDFPNSNYERDTLEISKDIGISDKQLRTEIGKIRNKIKNTFNTSDFFESRKNSGYRLNPTIQVIKKG